MPALIFRLIFFVIAVLTTPITVLTRDGAGGGRAEAAENGGEVHTPWVRAQLWIGAAIWAATPALTVSMFPMSALAAILAWVITMPLAAWVVTRRLYEYSTGYSMSGSGVRWGAIFRNLMLIPAAVLFVAAPVGIVLGGFSLIGSGAVNLIVIATTGGILALFWRAVGLVVRADNRAAAILDELASAIAIITPNLRAEELHRRVFVSDEELIVSPAPPALVFAASDPAWEAKVESVLPEWDLVDVDARGHKIAFAAVTADTHKRRATRDAFEGLALSVEDAEGTASADTDVDAGDFDIDLSGEDA